MAKFCGICGAILDEKTGSCPNCSDDELRRQDKLQSVAFENNSSIDRPKSTEIPLDKSGKKRIFCHPYKMILIVTLISLFILCSIWVIGARLKGPTLDIKALFEDYSQINGQALALEERYSTEKGYVPTESIPSLLKELEMLAKSYKDEGILESYELQEYSVFMKFKSGVGYLYIPTNPDLLSDDKFGSILTMEPYASSPEFITQYILGGKSPDKAAQNIANALPDLYSFEHNYDELLIKDIKNLEGNKIIIWYGHGGFVSEYGPVLGTSVSSRNQAALSKYSQELSNCEMLLGKDCFCLCPSYFDKNIKDEALDGSLIYLAACESARDNRLANVFLSKGAQLVVGNTRSIFTRYNLYMMYDFMTALTNQYNDMSYWTAEDALQFAKDKNGEKDGEFLFYGAEVRLVYPEGKSGYRLMPINDDIAAPISSNIEYENLVTDAYYTKITAEYGDCVFSIPQINISVEAMDTVNKEIWDELYVGVVEEVQANLPYVGGEYIKYDWAVNGDILSLWIESHPVDWAWWDYYVYNVSISRCTLISKDSLLNAYGLGISEYNELVRKALYSSAYYSLSTMVAENPDLGTITVANEILLNTTSDTNVEDAVPFLNEDGCLCIIGLVYSAAGADAYYQLINLEDFEVATEYPNPFALSSGQQNVLSNILGDWTDGHTEYRFFANETFEQNSVFFSSAKRQLIGRSNVQKGVIEVTGINTADLAPYTQPGSLQSWMKLIYDSQTDTVYVGNTSHPYYRMINWINGNTPDVTYNDPTDHNSGVCGDNVSWALIDGVLTIGGTGRMTDYTTNLFTPAPWYSMSNSRIKSVIITDGVTHIGNRAFDDCNILTSVSIPASVTSIGSKAFDGCDSLTDIYFAGNESQWNNVRISDDFITQVTVHYNFAIESQVNLPEVPSEKPYGDNITWTITDGVLRATGVGKMDNYTSTSYVPWYDERGKVTSVVMESGITTVGSYAFDGFGKVTSVTLPETIRSIEEFAFWRCDDLPSIVIPSGCTTIKNSAFNWCESLEYIVLPTSVTEIMWNAFANCDNLCDVYYSGTEDQWRRIDISGTGNGALTSATIHFNSNGPG